MLRTCGFAFLFVVVVCGLFVSTGGAVTLSIANTQLLWQLCQQSPECRHTFGIEALYSIGSTPLDDGSKSTQQMLIDALQTMNDARRMMEIPQFRAFQSVVFQQCALREAPGMPCSDDQLALLTAENLATDSMLNELWQLRLRLWFVESGAYCGPNYVSTVDTRTGSLECNCRLGKMCSDEFSQTLDGMFVTVLAFAIAILLGLTMVKDVFMFVKDRVMPEITSSASSHRNLWKFIQSPPPLESSIQSAKLSSANRAAAPASVVGAPASPPQTTSVNRSKLSDMMRAASSVRSPVVAGNTGINSSSSSIISDSHVIGGAALGGGGGGNNFRWGQR